MVIVTLRTRRAHPIRCRRTCHRFCRAPRARRSHSCTGSTRHYRGRTLLEYTARKTDCGTADTPWFRKCPVRRGRRTRHILSPHHHHRHSGPPHTLCTPDSMSPYTPPSSCPTGTAGRTSCTGSTRHYRGRTFLNTRRAKPIVGRPTRRGFESARSAVVVARDTLCRRITIMVIMTSAHTAYTDSMSLYTPPFPSCPAGTAGRTLCTGSTRHYRGRTLLEYTAQNGL